jgi:hypothetical protein
MATTVRTFRPSAKMPARTRVVALRRRGSQEQRAAGIPGGPQVPYAPCWPPPPGAQAWHASVASAAARRKSKSEQSQARLHYHAPAQREFSSVRTKAPSISRLRRQLEARVGYVVATTLHTTLVQRALERHA